MKTIIKKESGNVSIIAVLLITIAVLGLILGIKILKSNNEEGIKEFSYSNSGELDNFENRNKNDFSKSDIIALLEQGETYNNYSCEYILDEETGKTIQKYKDNVLCIANSSHKIFQNYTNDKHIVIDKNRKVAIISNLKQNKLIPLDKNYCSGLTNLLKDQNITYKCIKGERYNALECIVIEIEGTENNINNKFSFGSKTNYDNLKTTMNIWISKKSGLVAKIEAKYKTDIDEKFSKVVEYNLVLDNVTNNDIKEPDLSGYQVQSI